MGKVIMGLESKKETFSESEKSNITVIKHNLKEGEGYFTAAYFVQ